MEEYETALESRLINAELDLISKIERYLLYAIRPDDIRKLFKTFLPLFDNLDEQLSSNKYRGFFIMPVHRLFSFFIGRVLMKAFLESLPDGQNPSSA